MQGKLRQKLKNDIGMMKYGGIKMTRKLTNEHSDVWIYEFRI